MHLEEALGLAASQRERAEIALEVSEAYAALFRWVDAVDAIPPASRRRRTMSRCPRTSAPDVGASR